VLLNLLKGGVFMFSVAALVLLTAALVESWVQRGKPKDPDYLLSITLLRVICAIGLPVALLLTVNYSFRFYTGLAGSHLPGPEANSIFSLTGLIVTFAFLCLIAILLLWILWQADEPDAEELERRRRMARVRAQAELKRTQRTRQTRQGERREGRA
jgi:hypothetical protein